MTRSRAGRGEVATPLMAEYDAQRASAGLIISEGTQISQQGQGVCVDAAAVQALEAIGVAYVHIAEAD